MEDVRQFLRQQNAEHPALDYEEEEEEEAEEDEGTVTPEEVENVELFFLSYFSIFALNVGQTWIV